MKKETQHAANYKTRAAIVAAHWDETQNGSKLFVPQIAHVSHQIGAMG